MDQAHLRHLRSMLRFDRHPAKAVYESLGDDFFMAGAGMVEPWPLEGRGDAAEAPSAPQRLIEVLCEPLPAGGVILDVTNGLGMQDLVVAERRRPRRLIALNLSEFQINAGRERLDRARALPIATGAIDGLLCVEAAFTFLPGRPSSPRRGGSCVREASCPCPTS